MEHTGGRIRGRPGADSGWTLAANAMLAIVLFALAAYLLGRAVGPYFRDAPRVAPAMIAVLPDPEPLVVPGEVIGSLASGIGAVQSGVIAEMRVARGERVHEGDLLFRMETAALQARVRGEGRALARAERALQDARLDRAAALARLDGEIATLEARLARDRAARTRLTRPGIPPDTSVELRSVQARLAASYRDLTAARTRRHATAAQWDRTVSQAQRDYDQAVARLRRARAAVAEAKRFSPIAGIVTSIRAGKGDWVEAEAPVVRVDRPEGLKVVALVTEEQRPALAEQAPARIVEADGQRTTGAIEKIERGWDRHVFEYWVWVRPLEDSQLLPGERVQLQVEPEATETTTAA